MRYSILTEGFTSPKEPVRKVEDAAFLTVVEGDGLNVVQGVFAQVYLAVLGVAELYAVVEYAEVVGAHASHVKGLDTPHAAVVLELYSGEVAQGVGHTVGVESFQVRALQRLSRDNLFIRIDMSDYHRLLKGMPLGYAVRMVMRDL